VNWEPIDEEGIPKALEEVGIPVDATRSVRLVLSMGEGGYDCEVEEF